MNSERVQDLIRRYEVKAIQPGTEPLLRPEDAIALSHEAEALGIATTGVDVWVYSEKPGMLAEDAGAGRYVPDQILHAPYAVPASHAIVRDYLLHWLPASARGVYVALDLPNERLEEASPVSTS